MGVAEPCHIYDLDAGTAVAMRHHILPKWLDALCKNLDVFVIWYLLLIATGFAATNPKKLKGGKSFTIAFSMMAVYVVLRVGIAFISS